MTHRPVTPDESRELQRIIDAACLPGVPREQVAEDLATYRGYYDLALVGIVAPTVVASIGQIPAEAFPQTEPVANVTIVAKAAHRFDVAALVERWGGQAQEGTLPDGRGVFTVSFVESSWPEPFRPMDAPTYRRRSD